jgi:hypothetical protein
MSTRERVRVMLEWFGRCQTIALPINSFVGCLIATILLMILSENSNPMTGPHRYHRDLGVEQLVVHGDLAHFHIVRAIFSDKIISRMGGRSLGAVPC